MLALRDAIIRGWRYALRNQDEIIELIHREYVAELTPEHDRFAADEIRRLLIPDLIEIGYMNPARWEHIAAEFEAAGLLASEVDLEAFLFEPAVQQDWTWVYVTLLIAALLIGSSVVIALQFYRLNRDLRAEIDMRRELEARLKSLAITDAGTGVLNRRGFLAAIGEEVARSRRKHEPLSLLILDVDHFKRVNDTYGHAAGDHVLAELASRCRRMIRSSDIMGRLGGEEFAIMLPNTDLASARNLAERIRATTAQAPVRLPKSGRDVATTTSVGVALLQPDEALDAFMSRADGAMYEAKCMGRNRIVEAASEHQTARLMLRRKTATQEAS